MEYEYNCEGCGQGFDSDEPVEYTHEGRGVWDYNQGHFYFCSEECLKDFLYCIDIEETEHSLMSY